MLNIGVSITKNIEKYNSLINYMLSNNKFLKNKIIIDILLIYNINKQLD